jgi:hypothetical protein
MLVKVSSGMERRRLKSLPRASKYSDHVRDFSPRSGWDVIKYSFDGRQCRSGPRDKKGSSGNGNEKERYTDHRSFLSAL